MAKIRLEGVSKGFDGSKVLKDITFSVEEGEYVIVLGPSGCGKTTLLKTIAGLYLPQSGRIYIDGLDVTEKSPQERNIGFFFQHYSLFPHMSVEDNVRYGLDVRKVRRPEADAKVDELLRMVGLSSWAKNMPHELSGGMQQRVALARALALGSKILLLDEPLNALDAKISALLRRELLQMAKRMKLTVIHVTPNQEEAMELADRIILLNGGSIVQEGCDVELYTQPRNPFVAYFIGDSNFLAVEGVDSHTARFQGRLFSVSAEMPKEDVILAVRVEKVRFERREHNSLEGIVETINFLGKTTRYEVNVRGHLIHVETSKHPEIRAGDKVSLYIPPEDLMVFKGADIGDDDITVI
jgi:ABC-type Fe3+/spermidine/putrescine transport system ATPase subunit